MSLFGFKRVLALAAVGLTILLQSTASSAFAFLPHSHCVQVKTKVPAFLDSRCHNNLFTPLRSRLMILCASSEGSTYFVEADDLDAIEELFNKHSDYDGLMGKSTLMRMAPFSDMLADQLLMIQDLEDIWKSAPKYPEVEGEDTRIDIDSFIQIYQDVCYLFEEEEDDATDAVEIPANASKEYSPTN